MPRTLSILLLIALLCSACSDPVVSHMDRARGAILVADYQLATQELKQVLVADGNMAEARWLLGKIYLELGEIRNAEKEIGMAGKLGWSVDDVRPALAICGMAQGQFEQVLRLETEGMQPEAAARLLSTQAMAHLASGRVDEARQKVASARRKFPESHDAWLSDARILAQEWHTRAAIALVDKVLAQDAENAAAWRLRGQLLLQQENLPEARVAFGYAIDLSTVAFSDRVTYALISYQLGDFDAVRSQVDALLLLSPAHPTAHYIRGLMQFRDKEYRLAIKSFSIALPVATQYPMLLYYASIARMIDGDEALAAVHAEEFVDLAPDDIRGRKLLAMIRLEQKNAGWARSIIQPVLDYDEEDIEALKITANALLLEGRADEALDLYARVARLLPDASINELALGLLEPASEEVDGRYLDAIRVDQPDFPLTSLLQILEHLRAKDFTRAMKAARSFTLDKPSLTSAFYMEAKILLAAGQVDKAEEILLSVLSRDPGNPRASAMLASIEQEAGQPDTARRYYEESLLKYSNELSTLLGLARLEADQGLNQKAEIRLEQAVTSHPEALSARLAIADFYVATKRPWKVPDVFEPLEGLPQRSPQVLDLATTAARSPLRARATRASLERILSDNPEHIPSLMGMAQMAEAKGDKSEFENHLSLLTKLAPNEPLVLKLRARSADLNGEYALAAELSRRAYERSPSLLGLLTMNDLHKQAGTPTDARYAMLRWLEMNPYDPVVKLALAVNLESTGNLVEAKAKYNEILEDEPDNTVALNNMAWLLKEEDLPRATQYIRRAVAIAKDSPALLDTLAVIEYMNGNNARAFTAIQQAQALAPENAVIRYHKAMIIADQGKTTQAIASLEKLLAQDSEDFPEKEQALQLLQTLKAPAQN